jgi:hypothetical protein
LFLHIFIKHGATGGTVAEEVVVVVVVVVKVVVEEVVVVDVNEYLNNYMVMKIIQKD